MGAYELIEGASLYKTFTTGLRPWENHTTALGARKCNPPLVAGATTFPPLQGGTTTCAYCRAAYEESVSRCFILPPEQGWQGNTIRKEAKRPENRVTRFPVEKSGEAG